MLSREARVAPIALILLSFTASACAPVDYAIRVINLIGQAETTLHRPTVVPHTAGNNASGPIWSVDGLYALPNWGEPPLCSTESEVALFGIPEGGSLGSVMVFDATSGAEIWKLGDLGLGRVACSSDAIYVASSYSVSRRTPSTGEIEWQRLIRFPGDIIHIHYADGSLFVWNRPNDETTMLDATSGELSPLPQINRGERYLLLTENMLFTGYGHLQAHDLATSAAIWTAETPGSFYETPSFTSRAIFARTGAAQGTAYAIDRFTGQVLWQTTPDVVSNLLLSNGRLFLLTSNGVLASLDPATGKATELIRFEPSPLPLGGDTAGYYVAISKQHSILVVYMGASTQLMAFDLNVEVAP
jgi:outer membrane protein assembly factor BamB